MLSVDFQQILTCRKMMKMCEDEFLVSSVSLNIEKSQINQMITADQNPPYLCCFKIKF